MSSRTAGSSGASSFSGVAGAWPRKQKVDIYADIQHSHGPWKMMNWWKTTPWSDKNKVKTSTNSEFQSQLWQLCSITRLASYSWDHFWQSHPAGPAGRPPFLSGTSEENGLYISRGKNGNKSTVTSDYHRLHGCVWKFWKKTLNWLVHRLFGS